MKYIIILSSILLTTISCSKQRCKTCTKTIGGVAGNITIEEKQVCNRKEVKDLESSSSGTTVWECK